jgi:hypothetical protein
MVFLTIGHATSPCVIVPIAKAFVIGSNKKKIHLLQLPSPRIYVFDLMVVENCCKLAMKFA